MQKLRNFWVLTATIAITLFYSLKTLCITLVWKHPRARIDKLLRDWSRKLLKIVKASYKVYGAEELQLNKHQPYVIISNHASHYDIPLIFVAVHGSVRMIAKKELFRVPVWGRAMRAAEFIAIDREDRRQAVRDLRAAKEKMQSGIMIWVAPEGTRTRTGEMQAFKKGGFMLALQTGATIIPVGIRGSYNILPPKTTDFNLHEKVEIHIGAPINTAGYSSKDVAALMANVEAKVRVLAGQ
jgi:1-acyl-sn-glycerol-3-phosphate acyltransferase